MREHQHKRVFITGGSSGIGQAAALLLAQHGAHVCIAARRADALDDTLDRLRARAPSPTSQRLSHVTLDVADKNAVRDAAPRILEQLGGLDLIINSAGITHPGRALDLDDDTFERIMQVNYLGTVYVNRALLPTLIAQRHGHVCNVSSVAGFMGVYGYAPYAASKFALVGYSESLRQELLPHNVHLSLLFPPDTDTPMLHEERKHLPPQTRALTQNAGLLTAEDVAHTMLTGITARRLTILPGASTKAIHLANRLAPSFVRWVMDRTIKNAQ